MRNSDEGMAKEHVPRKTKQAPGATGDKPREKPIPGGDFKAWDKFDVNQALNDNDGSSRRPLQRRLDDGGGGEPSSPKGMNEEKLRKGIAEAKRLQVVVTIRRSRQQDRYIF